MIPVFIVVYAGVPSQGFSKHRDQSPNGNVEEVGCTIFPDDGVRINKKIGKRSKHDKRKDIPKIHKRCIIYTIVIKWMNTHGVIKKGADVTADQKHRKCLLPCKPFRQEK